MREGDELVFHEVEDPNEKYDMTRDEHGQRKAEWYLCPKERQQICIVNPYLYEIKPGHRELMTSLTFPLVVGSRFIGIVGMDINLAVLQVAAEAIVKRLFHGKGDVMLVSHGGLIAAASRFPDRLGRRLRDVAPDLAATLGMSGTSASGELWLHHLPIEIAGTTWTLSVMVPRAEILAAAHALDGSLRRIQRAGMQNALCCGRGLR